MAQERSFVKKSDIVIILSVLAAALLFLLWTNLGKGGSDAVAEIYVDGKLSRTIDLSQVEEPYLMELDVQLHVVLEVSPGGIRFIESECPDKICIHTGELTSPPDYAACLPARVAVKVVSTSDQTGLDGIAG